MSAENALEKNQESDLTDNLQDTFSFSAKVWLYSSSKAAWHFLTLPTDLAAQIREDFAYLQQGWGSLAVIVTAKDVTWETSLFPEKKSNSYILPLKNKIRQQAKIEAGDELDLSLKIKYSLLN